MALLMTIFGKSSLIQIHTHTHTYAVKIIVKVCPAVLSVTLFFIKLALWKKPAHSFKTGTFVPPVWQLIMSAYRCQPHSSETNTIWLELCFMCKIAFHTFFYSLFYQFSIGFVHCLCRLTKTSTIMYFLYPLF